MKTSIISVMMILLSFSCKKEKIEPKQPNDPQVQQCTTLATYGPYGGKYVSLGTSQKDTITIVFMKDNCPDKNYTYQINDLSQAFASWGVGISDVGYTFKAEGSKDGTIPDVLNIRHTTNDIEISVKSGNQFTPYLKFKWIH